MVDPKDFDTLSSELENRLDDLFGENDIVLPDVPEKNSGLPSRIRRPMQKLENSRFILC